MGFTLAAFRLPSSFPTSLAGPLFENHWFVWLALGCIAAALFWSGLNTRRQVFIRVGGGILFITVAWMTMALLVDTPRERLLNANKAVVSAAGHSDLSGVMAYLSPDVTLGNWDRNQIEQQLQQRFAQAHITGNFIRVLDTSYSGGGAATTHLVIWTQTSDYGPFTTEWRLQWQDQPAAGSWLIVHAELLSVNDQPVGPNSDIPE
ncbi:MAG TPA: hypothetical protein VMG59_10225 [Phycisphaerae bacterium]|nr:hypothetical protein [Phycisphaerae bacterium]